MQVFFRGSTQKKCWDFNGGWLLVKQSGIVEEINGSTAKVRIQRMTSCGGNCGSCGGCDNTIVVDAKNPIRAEKGDLVELEMSTKTVIGASFLAYVIPVVFLIIGYALGEIIFRNEVKSILIGISAMAISFCAVSKYSKTKTTKYDLIVEKIIN